MEISLSLNVCNIIEIEVSCRRELNVVCEVSCNTYTKTEGATEVALEVERLQKLLPQRQRAMQKRKVFSFFLSFFLFVTLIFYLTMQIKNE